MIYVVDTNIFSKTFRNISIDVFNDIWEPWSEMMMNGKIISVDEAYEELLTYWGRKAQEMLWLSKHKDAFQKMTNDEGLIVSEIFKNKKFREGIKESSLRSGTPEADAFLVAKAKVVGGVVVTDESNCKPNSEKIPNICVKFNVPYMKKNDFYRMLKNVHAGREELNIVTIYYDLEQSEHIEDDQ